MTTTTETTNTVDTANTTIRTSIISPIAPGKLTRLLDPTLTVNPIPNSNKPISFYLAASLFRAQFVKQTTDYLIQSGFRCTFDWVKGLEDKNEDGTPVNHSDREIEAVIESNYLIVLIGKTRGHHIEYGAGLAAVKLGLNIKIVLVFLDRPGDANYVPHIPFYDRFHARIDAWGLDTETLADRLATIMLDLCSK